MDSHYNIDSDHIDELRFMALESPRSMVEIYRTDLLTLVDMAEELLNIKRKQEEQ